MSAEQTPGTNRDCGCCEGISPSTPQPTANRPGLDALRDLASAGRLDRVLITAPDRLARNYVHQVLLVEELQGHGAEVEFLDRPMGQDPHDRLLLQIRGAVAEYEPGAWELWEEIR